MRGGRMIVNPVRYGKIGSAKPVKVTCTASYGTRIFYYNTQGEVIESSASGETEFTALAGSSVVTWGSVRSVMGIKKVATIASDYKCYLWQVNA